MLGRLLLCGWILANSAAWGQSLGAANDANAKRIRVHHVKSPFQAAETTVRVLLPDSFDAPSKSRQYRVLYVLPVVANAERKFGDGLEEVERYALHNKHQLICVAPEFSASPWFADHDRDDTKRDESHLLKIVLPLVEKNYPVVNDAQGRLLVGFSKSGWGAFSLLLRHPDKFHRAAGWDTGIRVDLGPISESDREARIGRIFGSKSNFEKYRLSTLLRTRGTQLGQESRLFYYSTEGKRAVGGVKIHELMVAQQIPHEYHFEPKRPHRWDSGWLPKAVEFLVRDGRKRP